MVALSVSPVGVLSQESGDSAATKVAAPSTHANTTEGLKELFLEMRAAAQDGNQNELAALVKQTEIPNCDAWLHKMYDSDKADSWMELCDSTALDAKEASMRELFKRLANADGRFLARNVNDNPQPGRGLEWGWLQAIKQPLDIYWAGWLPASKSNESEAEPIGYFMFIEGNFRWESIIQFTSVQSQDRGSPAGPSDAAPPSLPVTNPPPPSRPNPTRVRIGGNVQARQLTHSVPPTYPPGALSQHITGTVLLHVILATDGSVLNIDVVSGPDELRQAAIDAVKRWRYRPTLLNGKPIEVDTTIQVIFSIG
jgi:TonB family protein